MLAVRPAVARLGRGPERPRTSARAIARAAGYHEGAVALRGGRQAPRAAHRQRGPPASLRLTLRARAGDNTRLVAVPRITKEDLKQQLDGGASPVLVEPG